MWSFVGMPTGKIVVLLVAAAAAMCISVARAEFVVGIYMWESHWFFGGGGRGKRSCLMGLRPLSNFHSWSHHSPQLCPCHVAVYGQRHVMCLWVILALAICCLMNSSFLVYLPVELFKLSEKQCLWNSSYGQ
eukprot:GHVS01084885.1.p3 GENE.GHVS01084885.1~~GHVS01084885.1.p3  ORF type:complete len:132 (-),score=14.42 GHVS01084885.1:1323-1718(-)